jgi:hypothetical protein
MSGIVIGGLGGFVVNALLKMGSNALPNALPGVGANIWNQLYQLLHQKELDKKIKQAVVQGTEDFIAEQQGQAAAILQKLKHAGLFKKHSPIARALAVLALSPIEVTLLVEQEIERQMVASVPEITAEQCKQMAKSLIAHVRGKVNAIPQMAQAQMLMRPYLTYDVVAELLKQPLATLPDHLRYGLLQDAADAALRYHHPHVSTAHLLYALACRNNTGAQAALAQVGVTPQNAADVLKDLFDTNASFTNTTPSRTMERAMTWSRSVATENQVGVVREEQILEALLDAVEDEDDAEKQKGAAGKPGTQAIQVMLRRLHTTMENIRIALNSSQTTPNVNVPGQKPQALG